MDEPFLWDRQKTGAGQRFGWYHRTPRVASGPSAHATINSNITTDQSHQSNAGALPLSPCQTQWRAPLSGVSSLHHLCGLVSVQPPLSSVLFTMSENVDTHIDGRAFWNTHRSFSKKCVRVRTGAFCATTDQKNAAAKKPAKAPPALDQFLQSPK